MSTNWFILNVHFQNVREIKAEAEIRIIEQNSQLFGMVNSNSRNRNYNHLQQSQQINKYINKQTHAYLAIHRLYLL